MSNKSLYVEKIVVGAYAENTYIAADMDVKECIVVDPGAEFPKIWKKIEDRGLSVKYILLTHAHFDHIGAVSELAAKTGAKVYVNFEDEYLYKDSIKPDGNLEDGLDFVLGDFTFRTILTPGHTLGGASFYVREAGVIFTGDTLFYRSVGRTDLAGGSHHTLIKSIIEKLMNLPDDTVVYPGHSAKTTIGDERRHNLFLQG